MSHRDRWADSRAAHRRADNASSTCFRGSVAIRDRLVCCGSFLVTGTVNDRGTEQGAPSAAG
jgi:hypothetical protein